VLTLSTSIAMGSGGWGAGGCTMKWRNDKAGFRLIGITVTEMDRTCACGSSMDYNLLTGLKISRTDQDGNRNQMEKEIVSREKGKPEILLWEDFRYDERCVTR
jgi:hypothetical protein